MARPRDFDAQRARRAAALAAERALQERIDFLVGLERTARGAPTAGAEPRGHWPTQEALHFFWQGGGAGLSARMVAARDALHPEAGASMAKRRAWVERALGCAVDLLPLVGAARIAFAGAPQGGVWEPVDSRQLDGPAFGCPALILPAFEGGEIVDLLALPVLDGRADPTRWYRRTGLAATLGFDHGAPAWENFAAEGPVRLARTPLAWLRAWSRTAGAATAEAGLWLRWPPAACALDAAERSAQDLLLRARVIVDDEGHAAEIYERRERAAKAARARMLPKSAGAVASILIAPRASAAGG